MEQSETQKRRWSGWNTSLSARTHAEAKGFQGEGYIFRESPPSPAGSPALSLRRCCCCRLNRSVRNARQVDGGRRSAVLGCGAGVYSIAASLLPREASDYYAIQQWGDNTRKDKTIAQDYFSIESRERPNAMMTFKFFSCVRPKWATR